MKKNKTRIIMYSGWLVSMAFGIFIIQTSLAQSKIRASTTRDCPEPQAAQNLKPVKSRKPMMRVYVKPHPPAFIQGKWIKFDSYEKFKENGILKVRFRGKGRTTTIVDFDAVVWGEEAR